ncbi:chemotaxis protein CheW [Kineosporia succinea]|uniref:Purine-binding chemotaxis protein CheW n=1 Tax=Kineosporia succinea TaxID=84632 RepID=A0ABT9NYW3_9ACTN|nr:chemotaxis protein CheW [Kineosporia succinea]MDP9825637.1 purine-binding chemotaxis protein CheW [Kineosporia succinea]
MTATYGLFAIGEACVALPLSAVREVTPCPEPLAALPVSARGLLGAVNLRGQVIAVLDLLPEIDHGSAGHRVVVVMHHRDRLLGLLVDSVHGVTSPPALQQVGTHEHRLPVSHAFPAPTQEDEGRGIVSVLDVEALFALPGIPALREDEAGDGVFGADGTAADATDLAGSMLLVRCADHRLTLNIDAVHTIVPRVTVRSSPLRHGSCRGVTDYGGAEVPVFDPLALAGLGELSAGDTEGVAVKFRDGVVVMLLSEVLELIPASAGQRFTLPGVQVPGRRYLDGVVRVPGRGDFLSLSVEAILAHEDLNALSRLNTPPRHEGVPAPRAADDEESAGQSRAGGTYLTFSVGRDFAVPLEQVVEILPFPEQYSVLRAGDEDVLGLFTHRDTVVPLYRLSGLLRAGDPSLPAAYVLVVSAGPDGRVVGLAVHALRAIERSIWEDPAAPGEAPSGEPSLEQALARRRTIRLAAIGTSDEPRMLTRVDLSAVGAALVPDSPTRLTTTSSGTGILAPHAN